MTEPVAFIPSRLFLQAVFSRRGLVAAGILLLLTGGFLFWRHAERDRTVRELESRGAVLASHSQVTFPFSLIPSASGPKFTQYLGASLNKNNTTEDITRALSLGEIGFLRIDIEKLEPDALHRAAQGSHLTHLILAHHDLSARHLYDLGQVTSLLDLSFESAALEGGLDNLPTLAGLQSLTLHKYRFTAPDELKHLASWKPLRRLSLAGSSLTDEHLRHFPPLEHLEFLTLSDTAVTDAGLVHLQQLAGLQFLDLGETRVTNAGLIHLRPLVHLRHLGIERTAVTDTGLKSLSETLPQLEITD